MTSSNFLLAIFLCGFSVYVAEEVCQRNAPETTGRDPAADQLVNYLKNKQKIHTLTTDYGVPIGDKLNILTVGPRGPALLQDSVFIEEMAHFDREKIPQRVVHGRGSGAFGYFKVTNDITKYCKAKLFNEVGKVTPIAVRFSMATGDPGSPETDRDIHGFAVKFYTQEGNWDLTAVQLPVFFIRDPILFPSLVHAATRNPVTNLKDADMFWDFMSLMPETTSAVTYFFTDLGIPYSYRYMNGHGIHTFKLVNEENESVYCKFHYLSNQGIRNFTDSEATIMAGRDPDFSTRDLYNAIGNGDYPSWTLKIQVMTFKQASEFRFNPFDSTKYWPEDEYPLIEVGVLTLNKTPDNYFAQVEQMAFSPSILVPGIEPSPDKLLQGRLFSYPDTQRYRLGANYLQIPVNHALNLTVRNYERDGYQYANNQGGAPNYYPNSFCGPSNNPAYKPPPFSVSGEVERINDEDDDNFTQAGIFYRELLNESQKSSLVQNIANSLVYAQKFIQDRAVNNFAQADEDFGKRIMKELQKRKIPMK